MAERGANRRRALAAAVAVQADILRQHRAERAHVAAARGGEEGAGDLQPARLLHAVAGPCVADMAARPGGELPAGHGAAADGGGDFLEAEAEDVVQQEGGALQRRQALQRQHQRQGDVVGLRLRLLDQRLGQPGADIGFAADPRGF